MAGLRGAGSAALGAALGVGAAKVPRVSIPSSSASVENLSAKH